MRKLIKFIPHSMYVGLPGALHRNVLKRPKKKKKAAVKNLSRNLLYWPKEKQQYHLQVRITEIKGMMDLVQKSKKLKQVLSPLKKQNSMENWQWRRQSNALPASRLKGTFEDISFASQINLVNESTMTAVIELGFKNMAEIQHRSVRSLL